MKTQASQSLDAVSVQPTIMTNKCPAQVEYMDAQTLHARHLAAVYRFVAALVPRREDAEDVTAEVFAAAFHGLSRFDRKCPHLLWLFQIARRKVIDHRRMRRVRPEQLETDTNPAAWEQISPGDSPQAALERAERARNVRDLIGTLKQDQREALLLKYVEQLSVQEISVVLKRSPAAVNSLLQRARAIVAREGRLLFEESEDQR